MTKVQIKRFDKELPLPAYKTSGAAAVDLCARLTTTIEPHQVGLVPLNVAIRLPADHWVLLSARSSLHKKGVLLVNGIGVGDADFCGDGDEYRAALLNFTDQPVTLERGDRLVQMILMTKHTFEWQEVEHLAEQDRGGFGSTG
jgi:dUTP pyrophosphatase